MQIKLEDQTVDLSVPVVMSIINVTTDSFFSGSRTMTRRTILDRTRKAVADGAAILDIGGYSSRPGANDIPERTETVRVLRAMEIIKEHMPGIPVSIDTFRSKVIEEVVTRFGSCIVNDITAGEADRRIWDIAAKYSLPYIAMHMRGTPSTMQQMCDYDDIVAEVKDYLTEKVAQLHTAGVKQVIIDPGYGFAKTVEQNFELLRRQSELSDIGSPILAGLSRKTMIWRTLGITPAEALNGTTALNWEALRGGAAILRVHDTKEAAETIRLYTACYNIPGRQ